mmetsp:Transcript_13025/g.30706  ORF Transcript_13025/g.30706 Transcript_13025/m.30706 type:complete len:155 (-) Transcript_13025:486-950(-)
MRYYLVQLADQVEDIHDFLEDNAGRKSDWADIALQLVGSLAVAQIHSSGYFEDRIDTHYMIVADSVVEGIDAVLAYVANEEYHSVDPRNVEVVLTSADDVHNRYNPHGDHSILEEDHVEDSHLAPVYCSKVLHHQALCDHRLLHYLLHPRVKHE